MREFPGKRRNTFGLDNLITKLLKKRMSKRTHGVAYRLTSDMSAIRIKACMHVGKWWIFRTSDEMQVVTVLTNWTV